MSVGLHRHRALTTGQAITAIGILSIGVWSVIGLLAGIPPAAIAIGAAAAAALAAIVARLAIRAGAVRAVPIDRRVEAVVRDAATPAIVVAPDGTLLHASAGAGSLIGYGVDAL